MQSPYPIVKPRKLLEHVILMRPTSSTGDYSVVTVSIQHIGEKLKKGLLNKRISVLF
jgi:hypothetical protein